MSYTYPIGIPAAWIEPDVARPAEPDPWTAEVAGYYYVDEAIGNDTGRTYGSPNAPRKTIPAAYLGPGSYVRINGLYTASSGGFARLSAAGDGGSWVANTSGPVWFVGGGPGNRASFKAALIMRGSYGVIDYVDNLAGNKSAQFGSSSNTAGYSAHYMMVRNSEFSGGRITPKTGFEWGGQSGDPPNDLVMYNCSSHHWGVYEGPEDQANPDDDLDYAGTRIGNNGSRFWILDSQFHHNNGSGIGTSSVPSGTGGPQYVFIGRNESSYNWAGGIAAKGSRYVVWSQNICHDIYWTSWSGAKAFGAQYSVRDLYMIFNVAYNCDYGFKLGSTTAGENGENIYLIGNVFADIQQKPGKPYGGGESYSCSAISIWAGDRRFVCYNTIIRCKRGICFTSSKADSTWIYGNITVDTTSQDIFVDAASSTASIRNNLAYRSSGSAVIRLGANEKSVADANADWANVVGNIEANPLFVSLVAGDYNLTALSPAIGAGTPDPTVIWDPFTRFQAEQGVDIRRDRNGGTRPNGAGWDIGAFEYGASAPGASAPSYVTVPAITGTVTQGATITLYRGAASGIPSPTYTSQLKIYQADGVTLVGNVAGGTGTSYTIQSGDVGKRFKLVSTATNASGSVTANSAMTGIVTGTTVPSPGFSTTPGEHAVPGRN